MRWQDELKKSITTIEELKRLVSLTPDEEKRLRQVVGRHPMRIPRYYASLVDWADPKDPIRRLAVACEEELNASGMYDTSGEASNTKMPGVQHKYSQTALILATNQCAMYCRHCFRKRLVGLTSEEILSRFAEAVAYIKEHDEVNNVLITGGDPLVLPTRVIREFLRTLAPIDHLQFIRIGSRIPVTFPQRILDDDGLLTVFRKYSRKDKRLSLVTHFDHPKEITKQSIEAVSRVVDAGVMVNNQTVLLDGVNDDPDTLASLQNRLVGLGVNPYYVFQCRPVKRVKHCFQVPFRRGYAVVERAKKQLNGHSKRFRYAMSHKTGKIEIVGIVGDEIFLKYHQAKNPRNAGRFFKKRLTEGAAWLDDLA